MVANNFAGLSQGCISILALLLVLYSSLCGMMAMFVLEGIISGCCLKLLFHTYVVTSIIFSDKFLSTMYYLHFMLLVGISFKESN